MLQKILFLLIALNLFSCSYFQKEEKIDTRKPIAKVNNVFLYKEDITSILPENVNSKDSILIVKNFITSWAKKQILLSKARLNLHDERQIENLVNKYREDLLINKYKEAVIKQNLDTVIRQADIDTFYVKNKEILKLNEDLVQLKFIQTNKNIINRASIEKLFKSSKKEDIATLINKKLEFKSFYFNDSVWVKYSDVLMNIPVIEKKDLILASYRRRNNDNGKFIVKEDSVDVYLINIKKVLKRNSISPKSYVLPTIKQMILHTRKLILLKEIERTLLNDANKNGQYEIYE